MECYLVGGAVRDEVLGRSSLERDWVVVGATIEEMLALGYQPVGNQFPVFLHPETKEEYAMARTERKVGRGYHGFTFYTSPDVTLEQDLLRRDLTINAMAKNVDTGVLIDPYGGKKDCREKVLRHVSSAFVEDPVRVLRLARFAAQLPNFTVADDTMTLVKVMVSNEEVASLVPERVWREVNRALAAPAPHRFFKILHQSGALKVLMPEFSKSGDRWLNQITRVCERVPSVLHRFAAIWGFACTPSSLQAAVGRLKTPAVIGDLARMVTLHGKAILRVDDMNAQDLLVLFNSLDAFRREPRFLEWIESAQAAYSVAIDQERLLGALHACSEVDVARLQSQGLAGVALGQAIEEERRQRLEAFLGE